MCLACVSISLHRANKAESQDFYPHLHIPKGPENTKAHEDCKSSKKPEKVKEMSNRIQSKVSDGAICVSL